jgi:site-specific DNA-methyltransferase (adenine-specific)
MSLNPDFTLSRGDVLDFYDTWDGPDCIVSDGPYGLGLYPGEPRSIGELEAFYRPHVSKWSQYAKPSTTLWFWNTEVGWASVHNLLESYGWKYETCHVWDKGISHIAGNVNGSSIRRFPATTEVCVFYSRAPVVQADGGPVEMKHWLRNEWKRSGLPLAKANEACDVRNAATRKYLTKCDNWYFPPGSMVVKLAKYAETHGDPTDRPYFSLCGHSEITAEVWDSQRYAWTHEHGVTNVWKEPSLHGEERVKQDGKTIHCNQKPLSLMKRILNACTKSGAVVWEPFGGMCSVSLAALQIGRRPYAAELLPAFCDASEKRLTSFVETRDGTT